VANNQHVGSGPSIRFTVKRVGRFWFRPSEGRSFVALGTDPFISRGERGTPFVVQMLTRGGSVLQVFPAESRKAGNDVIDRLRRELAGAASLASFLEGHGVPTHRIHDAVVEAQREGHHTPRE
jgi:hypothetical protein